MATPSRTFRIQRCLGRGGFGEVYKARMIQPGGLQTHVALKVLLSGLEAESQPVERLRDEGRLLARLEHPVILKAIDVVTLDGRVALVAEYVDGQDLAECARGQNRMPIRPLVQVLSDIAGALDAAYHAGGDDGQPLRMIHRDIKPSNIRIGRHGEVKLLDFGIARSDSMAREARTATQMMVGSLQYMAPERFTERDPGPEADVFALGACLYEGITGRRLYQRIDPPKALRLALDPDHHRRFIDERLEKLPDTVADELRALLTDTLQHTPEHRPTTAQLSEQLDRVAGGLEGPSLRAWARERTWPEPTAGEDGPLVGRVFSDTLDGPLVELESTDTGWARRSSGAMESTPSGGLAGRTNQMLVGMIGVLVLVLVAAVIGVSMLAGVALWGTTPSPSTTDLTAPDEAPREQPAPELEPPPAPQPALAAGPGNEQTEPTENSATPQPSPVPVAAPSETEVAEPAPDPTPVPVVATEPGVITVTGVSSASLRGPTGRASPGSQLKPGEWSVLVDFGAGETEAAKVTLESGQKRTVQCNALLASCTVR